MNTLARLLLFWGLANSATAQPLDWAGDVTIFGTSYNESAPALASHASLLRAFCVVEGDTLAMKHSADNGVTWNTASRTAAQVSSPVLVTTSDLQYAYVLCRGAGSSNKHLFRFAAGTTNWSEASELDIAPERTSQVIALWAMTDAAAQPMEPYLNICWMERDAGNVLHTVFAQSRDRGGSFLPAVTVHSATAPESMPANVSVAATWSEEDERIHIVAPVDRTGSMPEELRVFTSIDQGVQWSQGTVIDSSGFAQRSPSLAAFGSTLLVVYARRSDVTGQRDIYFTYSPDGGLSYAPVNAVSDSSADEFDPCAVINATGEMFYVFYMVSAGPSEAATLMVRSGAILSPWDIGPASPVSDPLSAVSSGGYAVAVSNAGVAAVWTASFITGDTDIRFDASWRGTEAAPYAEPVPSTLVIGAVSPNPFNNTAMLPLRVGRDQRVDVFVTDVLGRRVADLSAVHLSPGEHRISIDLSGHASGVYWLHTRPHAAPQRLLLLR